MFDLINCNAVALDTRYLVILFGKFLLNIPFDSTEWSYETVIETVTRQLLSRGK